MPIRKRLALAATAIACVGGMAAGPDASAAPTSHSAQADPTSASKPASGFEGFSCGYNNGNGYDPTQLSGATTDHSPRSVGPVSVEVRQAYSSAKGRWFAWSRITTGWSGVNPGSQTWMDWTDDGGSTYHACGSPWHRVMLDQNLAQSEGDPPFQAHSQAVDWVSGRKVAACAAYWDYDSNGVPYIAQQGCAGYYLD
ncbi:hypothetical protein [Streptomyces sp. NPDC046759]|uniref:hypothetical protein n=1 Tax=Streptomyces sp. NPDC046759 TaxID=3155019 RepID=UPI0034017064